MSNKNAHSKLAPSASHRWMNCPGSVQLCEKVPEPIESEYAAEGTAAHTLGSTALLAQKDAREYLGNEYYGFKVTEEMAKAVQVYIDAIRERLPKGEFKHVLNTLFMVEQKFDLAWLHNGMYGSSDACIYHPEEKRLIVTDYKHGVGVEVDPEWNSQAMIYALGAIHDLWSRQTEITKQAISVLQMIETVDIIIVQPRVFGADELVKVWTVKASDLIYWGVHILKAAAVATEQANAPLRVGKHCRFCPALSVCPEQARTALAVAKTEFGAPVLPSPELLSSEQLLKVMELSDAFGAWADSVRAYIQKRMEMGQQFPGWKLVQKKANREWKDDALAEDALKANFGDGAFEKKLLSVKKAEDLGKKLGIPPESWAPLWTKPDNGVTMAPDSDKRTPVIPPAAHSFLEDAAFLK